MAAAAPEPDGSEDELKRSSEKLQKLTDRYVDEMDKVGKTKEQEILEV